MERETLLTILLLLFSGLALQPLMLLPQGRHRHEPLLITERRLWRQLWLPVAPTFLIAAWLFGWALREPDPVHDRVDGAILFVVCLPLAAIVIRAAFRAVWTLVRKSAELPICTAGLLIPRVVFCPFFARALDEELLCAAWEHEQAHVRHYDPLRIWLAQIATDLQWPWPSARRRFGAWLEILEHARDDEARSCGVDGADLAAAVLATVRMSPSALRSSGALRIAAVDAALIGNTHSLQTRIARLLSPLPHSHCTQPRAHLGNPGAIVIVAVMLVAAGVLGALYGESILHPLLAWTCSV